MTIQLRAHFDGRVIVPDEPLDVPVNQPLVIQVSTGANGAADSSAANEAFERLLRRVVPDAHISAESLRRESLYEGR